MNDLLNGKQQLKTVAIGFESFFVVGKELAKQVPSKGFD